MCWVFGSRNVIVAKSVVELGIIETIIIKQTCQSPQSPQSEHGHSYCSPAPQLHA